MNYRVVFNVLGRTLIVGAVLLLFPLLVNFVYRDGLTLHFLLPSLGLLALGVGLCFVRTHNRSIQAKEGTVIVALAWLVLSLVGAIPFVTTRYIPNFIDALFETISGFTTTGATVVADVEAFPHSILFWRSFTHFIGGMGVLVFVLAVIPKYNEGLIHVFKAESPGPTSSKLVSKIKFTAQILYAIYILLTIIETILLMCGGMPVFDSMVHAFSTAGTGGFSIKNNGLHYYKSTYIEVVVAVFMFLFSLNFNIFYLVLIGNVKKAFKSEELRAYTLFVVGAVTIIAINLCVSAQNLYNNVGYAIKDAFFQVTSISSTTGMSNGVDFDTWPTLSKSILMVCMIVGAMAGSTGGGIKMARVMLLFKTGFADIKRILRPRTITSVKFEGEPIESKTSRTTQTFFFLWFIIVVVTALILAIDGFDIISNLSATLACLGNVGPGFGAVGPTHTYASYSWYSKLVLSFDMLAGRLEIFPMLTLLQPSTWKR